MKKRRGAEAARKFTEAQELRAIGKELDEKGHDGGFEYLQADRTEKEAEQLLKPAGKIVRGSGGEAMEIDPSASAIDQNWNLIETLKHPDSVSLSASRDRLEWLADVDVLEPALDAAQSIQAANSLEKMLAHQMATLHWAAMKLLARGVRGLDRLPPVEATRLTNAAARIMDVYQAAFLTLMKVRTGGKQTVVVQHVQVSDGGQAVIAGNIKARDRGPRGGAGAGNA